MCDSPFVYGRTVKNLAFTDREANSKKLYSNLVNGVNTMLISPRRWGKSSLVEKVVRDIACDRENYRVVVLDLFSVGSKEEFLEMFARELLKVTSSELEDVISNTKEFLRKIVPRFSIGIEENSELSLSFDWEDLSKHSDEILNLPELIAIKKGVKIIICLDEFQDITSFSDYPAFEKKMRAVWQRQSNVTYCIYGSKRHMMTDVFNNSSKPFYRFGDIIFLEKIPREKWMDFILNAFKRTNKVIEPRCAALIADIMNNHSWYVQQFANYVWTKSNGDVTDDIMRCALDEIVVSNKPLFQREIDFMSITQLNFIKAVAMGEKSMFAQAVMIKYHMGTSGNVRKNRIVLTEKDIISFENGVYEFLDPVFELWFKKMFFNLDYLSLIK